LRALAALRRAIRLLRADLVYIDALATADIFKLSSRMASTW
jgi:hypothetical protein